MMPKRHSVGVVAVSFMATAPRRCLGAWTPADHVVVFSPV